MGVTGKINAPFVTDDNPISVNLKFYQFESLVEVGGLTLSEMNASITGGQIVPGFLFTNQSKCILLQFFNTTRC